MADKDLEKTINPEEQVNEAFTDETVESEENAATEAVNSEDEASANEGADAEDTIADADGDEEAEADEDAENADGSEKEGKGFFKKKKSDKKDPMKEKVDELEDKVKRQLAEFENFRNRTEKEKTQMFETGAKSVIEKILPVVDNFERGLATVSEEDKKTPFAEGMEMIYKQLISELEKIEVKPIEAIGTEFNPDLHNAVMQVESEEYESGIVAQELMKGYTYRGTVVRHSMVAVVQ